MSWGLLIIQVGATMGGESSVWCGKRGDEGGSYGVFDFLYGLGKFRSAP